MRISTISTVIVLASVSAASAQTYVTSEQPYATSVPVYDAYEPTAFDDRAYQAATQPVPLAPNYETVQPLAPAPVLEAQPPTSGVIYHPAPNDPALGDNLSLPLGAPETFAVPEIGQGGEIRFAGETETSRLLLALEETYATRVSEMKVKHLAQRRAMLDAFETEASDPNKVIGLAGRMRAGLAELEAAQAAALAVEEQQYTAAMLSVLDRAPSRVE